MSDEKLQKVMAAAGFGSRREMERVIEAGEVKVNGKQAHLGERVKPGDKVQWHNRSFEVPKSTISDLKVVLYNKPEGEICSRNDPEGRPTVFDRLPALPYGRWVSVGRLDFNTSGLLLFTNDGELANTLMHPSTGIDREYMVRVQGQVEEDVLQRLRDGVMLEDGMARFSDIKRGAERDASNSWFHCVVMEGRNREVRRLWESQNLRVSRLKRVRYGPIIIPPYVLPGQWLELDDASLSALLRIAPINKPGRRKTTPRERDVQERRTQRLRVAAARKSSRKPKPGRR